MPRIDHPIIDTPESVAWKGPLSGTDHTVIRVPELDVAIPWYQAMLGLVPTERRNDKVYLMSPVTGRIVLGLSEGGIGLGYVSFRARTAESFEAVATKLDANSIDTTFGVDTTREGARSALRIELPTGHAFEVVEHETDAPPAPVQGSYRPGAIDVRPSHLQLRSTDVTGVTDFLGVLGFRSSLFVPLPDSPGYFIQFLRVNDIHHQVTVLTGREGVHHVALEVDEADFWRFLDNLALTKLGAEYGPVRHHEGNMLSIYVRDPFGNRIEVTSTMETVGFDYVGLPADQAPWYHLNMWGPGPPESWEREWM